MAHIKAVRPVRDDQELVERVEAACDMLAESGRPAFAQVVLGKLLPEYQAQFQQGERDGVAAWVETIEHLALVTSAGLL